MQQTTNPLTEFAQGVRRGYHNPTPHPAALRLGRVLAGATIRSVLLAGTLTSGYLMHQSVDRVRHPQQQESTAHRYGPGIAGLVLAYGVTNVAKNQGRARGVYNVQTCNAIVVQARDGRRSYFVDEHSSGYVPLSEAQSNYASERRAKMDEAVSLQHTR